MNTATRQFEPLLYGSKEMSWEPVNIGSASLRGALLNGEQVFVRLEPEDATRYDLLITWGVAAHADAFRLSPEQARHALIVIRLRSDDVIGATLYGDMNYGSVSQLSNGNEWSATLLTWWLDELLRRLNA